MPPRAHWEGYLKLSLVSRRTFSCHQQQGQSLLSSVDHRKEAQTQYFDTETNALVPREGRVKGYEVGKDEYVIVSEDELTAIDLESNHSINIESFVERSEVETVNLYQRYYIAPEGKVGQEAFAVIREAMRQRLCGPRCFAQP